MNSSTTTSFHTSPSNQSSSSLNPHMEAAMIEPSYGMDKLSYEIFSILESKFLFGSQPGNHHSTPATPARGQATPLAGGKVRVLSIDAGGSTGGLLAAASLTRMEAQLRLLSGDPAARISDFFDLAAGSGAGGVLVALLFTRLPGGRQPLSAAEAMDFLARHYRELAKRPVKKHGPFRGLFGGGSSNREKAVVKLLKKALGESTLRDTAKPLLIPCYDLATGAPFLFSRADAVEAEGYDFRMWEVCAATMGAAAAGLTRSVDGRTGIASAAVDGGVVTGNPAAAAVTHVLNNRREFPAARGVDDLLLVSLGNGECGGGGWRPGNATPTHAGIVRIAGEGVSDMIDQAVAMAFGPSRSSSYVRIQGRDLNPSANSNGSTNPTNLLVTADEMLSQKNVESVLFLGKKLSQKSNKEKLEWAAEELLKEQQRRSRCPFPIVVFKAGSPPRSSSSALSSPSSPSSP